MTDAPSPDSTPRQPRPDRAPAAARPSRASSPSSPEAAADRPPTGPDSLRDRVCLVAGATRGAGRGIAVALGAAGATVYCTGRSTRQQRSEYNRPETIEETAEQVTEAGGTGIAAPADHLDPEQVRAVVEQVDARHGRLDVLVNDIWGGETMVEWSSPLWEHDLATGLRVLRLAVDTHLVTSHFALPLLLRRPGGLVVEVTDGTTGYNATNYRVNTFYDLAKVAVGRLGFSQGTELGPRGATAVTLTPGWLRSEMMLEHYDVTEATWWDATTRPRPPEGPVDPGHFAISESPAYVGRAVVALAADPDRARWNTASLASGQLARHYGFTDVDGSRPDAWRYLVEVQDAGKPPDVTGYR